MEVVNTVGRRKAAVARVYVKPGKGQITINRKALEVYFPLEILQYQVKQPLLATNTVACLQAGGILGTACMLDGLLDRFKEELGGEITVFATGTLASAIRTSCRTPILYRKTLILDGLYAIWRRNTKA